MLVLERRHRLIDALDRLALADGGPRPRERVDAFVATRTEHQHRREDQMVSQNSIRRGTLYGARLRAQWSMISSAAHLALATTRATTTAPVIGSDTTSAWAALIFGNASRQPSTSPSATRLPSTLTTSSSRPVRNIRLVLSILPRSPVRNQPC